MRTRYLQVSVVNYFLSVQQQILVLLFRSLQIRFFSNTVVVQVLEATYLVTQLSLLNFLSKLSFVRVYYVPTLGSYLTLMLPRSQLVRSDRASVLQNYSWHCSSQFHPAGITLKVKATATSCINVISPPFIIMLPRHIHAHSPPRTHTVSCVTRHLHLVIQYPASYIVAGLCTCILILQVVIV